MNELIKFEKITVKINDRAILQDTDFVLTAGEFAFISGKIGSGKTTFLRTIYADLKIEKGYAKVLDFNLSKIKKREIPFLRRQIGFIFQDFKFLNTKNIYENLKFVLEATNWKDDEKIDERIKQVLDEVDMSHKINAMPFELSGGEMQKIALARALLNNPKIILADEPTGNLDDDTAFEVTEKLIGLSKKNTAVIFVTHNSNLIKKYNNKIYRLENKKLIL